MGKNGWHVTLPMMTARSGLRLRVSPCLAPDDNLSERAACSVIGRHAVTRRAT
jgi:hypothetical protein